MTPEVLVVESDFLHCNDTVQVFSPTKAKDAPTLFLLHGYSDDYHAWSNHVDLQKLSEETGWRIICPDGFYASWYMDRSDPSRMQWRSFFWRELWPLLDKRFGLLPDRTFITGLSMGGHGAINIFLDHPERFRGAGSMSGLLDLRTNDGTDRFFPAYFKTTPLTDAECEGQSAYQRVQNVKTSSEQYGFDVNEKLIVITSGLQDMTYRHGSIKMAEACERLGLKYLLCLSPERHSWNYWMWAINYHIQWFTQHMERKF